MTPNKADAPSPANASLFQIGRRERRVGDLQRYPIMNFMRRLIISLLAICWISSLALAQEQSPPTIRILPEDIVQDSVRQFGMATNKFMVTWTYTEAAAKKILAFRSAHDGQEVVVRVGGYGRPSLTRLGESKPGGRTEESWLKLRRETIWGVSEEEAKGIIAGLKGK